LSQLLGELISCLRALLVARLDDKAEGDGIPEIIWKALVQTASTQPVDRLLAAIDVFAETEGRMKWATNKRLHLELGIIKAIQTLGEVRLSDVIKILAAGADHLPSLAPSVPSVPSVPSPTPAAPLPAQEWDPAPAANEAPSSAAPATKRTPITSRLDSLIEAAPEVSEPVAPPPAPAAPKPVPQPAPPPPAPTKPAEDFHNDPLIHSALEIFRGRIVS